MRTPATREPLRWRLAGLACSAGSPAGRLPPATPGAATAGAGNDRRRCALPPLLRELAASSSSLLDQSQ